MIAIIDYNAGNLTSVRLALEYIGVACEITREPAQIRAAERVIFPGVGAAGEAMKNLQALGLLETLQAVIAQAVRRFWGSAWARRSSSSSPKRTAARRASG